MSLTKNEFKVLKALADTGESLTQRDISACCSLSLGSVNSTVRSLERAGLMASGRITEKGVDALAPYQVRNAVIMAAGLGSRYGGSKQVDGIGPHNEILMEYSIYDALRAGFNKVVFIIKPEMEAMMNA